MHFRTAAILLLLISACGRLETSDRGKRFDSEKLHVENALDLSYSSEQVSIMSDEGAHFGFALHNEAKLGFAGPYMTDGPDSHWLAEEYIEFRIDINGKDASERFKIKQHSEPGMLVQELENEQLYLQLRLFFHDPVHVLIDISIQNLTGARTEVDLHWLTPPQEANSNILSFNPNGDKGSTQRINILSYEHRTLQWIFFHDKEHLHKEKLPERPLLSHAYEENCKRWKSRTAVIAETSHKTLASKCIQTLVTNYRPLPRRSQGTFLDLGAGNRWPQAAALAKIEPEWAKEQIRALLDQWNERNTTGDTTFGMGCQKSSIPPLAAWAVWNVYEACGDTTFLKECIEPLNAYVKWSSSHPLQDDAQRDYILNDSSTIAVEWEDEMIHAFRYADIQFMSRIYKVLEQAPNWNLEQIANELKVTSSMSNFTKSHSGLERIEISGPEAWILLWTGIATKEQANVLVAAIMDESRFNTHVPFPTLAADHPEFDPENAQSNGSVRLDLAYFALGGLRNYDFHDEATLLQEKLLNNAEGLLTSGPSIRANYDPMTGAGLKSYHDPSSAAYLLLLLTMDQH